MAALLAQLPAAPGRPLASVRVDVARGMTSDLETRRARDSIVGDLDRFIQAQATSTLPEFRTWLAATIAEYEQWLARIARPAP
jgi:hypothetical protein